jgi:hypothetical protein
MVSVAYLGPSIGQLIFSSIHCFEWQACGSDQRNQAGGAPFLGELNCSTKEMCESLALKGGESWAT